MPILLLLMLADNKAADMARSGNHNLFSADAGGHLADNGAHLQPRKRNYTSSVFCFYFFLLPFRERMPSNQTKTFD